MKNITEYLSESLISQSAKNKIKDFIKKVLNPIENLSDKDKHPYIGVSARNEYAFEAGNFSSNNPLSKEDIKNFEATRDFVAKYLERNCPNEVIRKEAKSECSDSFKYIYFYLPESSTEEVANYMADIADWMNNQFKGRSGYTVNNMEWKTTSRYWESATYAESEVRKSTGVYAEVLPDATFSTIMVDALTHEKTNIFD